MTGPVAEFPKKLEFLFKPARYKVAYGGRGSAKSWSFGRALLILGAMRPFRIICAREFQNSIADSVHALLASQLEAMGLAGFYKVLETEIVGANGTDFSFKGIRRNIDSIKSFEGADILWVEEAQTTGRNSWEKLIPTIRKPGSEIWVSFNPELDTDETYQRYVVNPPPGAIVVKVNWSDNPWFPDVLRDEMEHLKATDVDAYLNIWEGHCRTSLAGAIFANEIREATQGNRITRVPYDRSLPVSTSWDLGRSDMTAIWFIQQAGLEYRAIDYYEASGYAIDHYLRVLQERGYVYGTHYLPHDARNKVIQARKSIQEQVSEAYSNKVKIVERVARKAIYINACRTLFPRIYFDENGTADGLKALRHWRYGVKEETGQRTTEPLHDWASHGSEALCQFAMGIKDVRPDEEAKASRRHPMHGGGGLWMG